MEWKERGCGFRGLGVGIGEHVKILSFCTRNHEVESQTDGP